MTLLQTLVPRLGRVSKLPATNATEPAAATVKPVYEIAEDDHGYTVTVQLPGVAKDGLEITAQEGELTLTGRRAWAPPADWTALYRETPRANFALTLSHGNDIAADKIGAELKDGILRLTLPKAEAAKPRKISIS
jgi:HSP20 family molecular chaperone IbpA